MDSTAPRLAVLFLCVAKLTKQEQTLIRVASFAVNKLQRVLDSLDVYPNGVACSFAPYTILSNAFSVHRAVLTLCRAGLPSEAVAVSRIMIEMYIGLRWMTNQDQNKRCEEYVRFVAARKKHIANVREEYYAADPNTPEYVKWVDDVFGKHAAKYKDFNFWADVNRKLWGMASEPEVLYNVTVPYPDLKFDYKSFYSVASDNVHATMEALVPLVPSIGVPYRVPGVNPARYNHLTELAVIMATCWFLYIIARVDAWRKLGIRKDIDAASLPFERAAGIRRASFPAGP